MKERMMGSKSHLLLGLENDPLRFYPLPLRPPEWQHPPNSSRWAPYPHGSAGLYQPKASSSGLLVCETEAVVLIISELLLGSFFPLKEQCMFTAKQVYHPHPAKSKSNNLYSFHLTSVPFSSNWQCFYSCNPINSLSGNSPATSLVFSLEHVFSFFTI